VSQTDNIYRIMYNDLILRIFVLFLYLLYTVEYIPMIILQVYLYYYRVAKLIGDKRAVVAERGFNRPYSKVIVTNCGLMQ